MFHVSNIYSNEDIRGEPRRRTDLREKTRFPMLRNNPLFTREETKDEATTNDSVVLVFFLYPGIATKLVT